MGFQVALRMLPITTEHVIMNRLQQNFIIMTDCCLKPGMGINKSHTSFLFDGMLVKKLLSILALFLSCSSLSPKMVRVSDSAGS